jgi:glycosyltransferase involved in cell wall biosynthesis
MKPRPLFLAPDNGGCYFYRGYIPLAHLNDLDQIDACGSDVILDYEWFGRENHKFDVIGFQRPMGDEMMNRVNRFKSISYVDIDDNFFALPSHNPCYWDLLEYKRTSKKDPIDTHKLALSKIEIITTTTPQLKEAVTKATGRTENIVVIPNAIYQSHSESEIDSQRSSFISKRKISVGWWGGMHHQEDWKVLDDLLVPLVKKYYDKVDFCFLGWAPLNLMKTGMVQLFPWVNSNNFYDMLFSLDFDICIAPLVENEFSVCKSNIKFLETGMFKRCFVGSNCQLWNKDIVNGENGFLADKIEDFPGILESLIENRSKITEVGKAAYKYVMENYHINKMAPKWMSVLNHLSERSKTFSYNIDEDEKADYEREIRDSIQAERLTNMISEHKLSLKDKKYFFTAEGIVKRNDRRS